MARFAGAYDIGAKMVQDGWAMALNQERPDYLLSKQKAKASKSGIWRGTVVNPWDWQSSARSR
jgi:endonuclease YncB( thermonuclease family)